MSDAKLTRTSTPRARRMARQPQSSSDAAPSLAPQVAKSRMVLALLQRPVGCSLDELVAATGWQPHTTRAVLSGLGRRDIS